MVDTGDLKSPGSDTVPVRVRSPAPSKYRGVEQLVARRAHNPEVGGSSPSPATNKKSHKIIVLDGFVILFLLFCVVCKSISALLTPTIDTNRLFDAK